MIKIRVRTKWKHRVGIRDRYVKQALNNKEDLLIYYYYDSMLIPYDEIEKKIIGRSKKPIPDYYSDEKHFLIYFVWKPSLFQKKLL